MINQKHQEWYNEFKNLSQDMLSQIFLGACFQGDLEQVKFLLTYPKLKNHANIHENDDLGFQHACSEGHLEIVKYFLSSKDLKENINIHIQNDLGFRLACTNNHLNVVEHFIFNCNIKKSKPIKDYFKRKPSEKIENMFKIRELNENLNKTLPINELNKKQPKL